MKSNTIKRRILRRIPILSKLAKALDSLEIQNNELREQLEQQMALRNLPQFGSPELLNFDDVPLPPDFLRRLVSGTDDVQWFLESGQAGVQALVNILARQHMEINQFESLLDFGCGCARVLRHLRSYDSVNLHGSDYNSSAIRWCDENLNFAEFNTNMLEPPTRYRAHSFDLIYAFSVFTHLTEPLQIPWIRELHRILKPNGYLIITVHGDIYLDKIPEAEREKYQIGRAHV